MKVVARNIRLLRQKKGWRQRDVAKKMDMSTAAFCKIESGVTSINVDRLRQLASIFSVSISELFFDENVMQIVNSDSEVAFLKHKLKEKDLQLMELQRKLIDYYERSQKS